MDDDARTLADGPRALDDAAGLIGVDVGGYVIERELGRGGMGIVYAATHPLIGKRAAIKVLDRSLSARPAIVERFVQEARSVNQIGHPNIVDIFALGTLPDGRSYLVMDLLVGESLRARVRRSAVPVHEALPILDEIAAALIAAHDKGFIHRDLKPDNVFLVSNPNRIEIKVLDFGLAKLATTAMTDRVYRTATGAQIGTPEYMSPEQLRGSGVDHRTDIYALGIMAFEMLTHSRPHRFADGTFDLEGTTFHDELLAVPGMQRELAELIDTMVALDPERRPTLAAVRAVLRRVRGTLSIAVGANAAAATSSPEAAASGRMTSVRANAGRFVLPQGEADARPTNVIGGAKPANVMSTVQGVGPLRQTPAPRALVATPPHAGTKLGVPPPPAPLQTPHPVAAARQKRENPTWLIVALVLVAVAALALVLVLR